MKTEYLQVIRVDGIEGVGLHPVRINPLKINRNVNFTEVNIL